MSSAGRLSVKLIIQGDGSGRRVERFVGILTVRTLRHHLILSNDATCHSCCSLLLRRNSGIDVPNKPFLAEALVTLQIFVQVGLFKVISHKSGSRC